VSSDKLTFKYYEYVMAEWPEDDDVNSTMLTFDWLLDQKRYVENIGTEQFTDDSIEELFDDMPRIQKLTIDTLPDSLWDAGKIQIRSRGIDIERNLVKRDVFYHYNKLHTRLKYIPARDCPKPFNEPPLMVTVQDIIDLCVESFGWLSDVSEQRMAAFIYDLGKYESYCDADKLDIIMFHVESMLDALENHCSVEKFFDLGNIDYTLERAKQNSLLHKRNNTDHYTYRKYLIHAEEGNYVVL